MLKVTWDFTVAADATATYSAGFRVYYKMGSQFTSAAAVASEAGADFVDVPMPAAGLEGMVTLVNLMPGKEYFAAVAARTATVVAGGADTIALADPVVRSGDSSAAGTTASAMTQTAPLPAPPMNVMVKGGSKMLTVSWDASTFAGGSGITVKEYRVRKQTVELGKEPGPWLPSAAGKMFSMSPAVFEDLMDGVMYAVQVQTVNSAGGMSVWTESVTATVGMEDDSMPPDEEEEPMGTPALPLFGILALFAGLLAAGRARLRR